MQKQRRRNRKVFITPVLLILKSSYAFRITLILCTFACTLSEVYSSIVSDGLILSSGNNNSNFDNDNEIIESNSTDNSSTIANTTTESISISSIGNNDSIIIINNSSSNLSVITEQNQNDSRKIVLCGQRLYYVINMVCSFNHMPFSNDQLFNSQISNETYQYRYPRSEPPGSSNSTNNHSTNLTSQSNSSELSGSYEESNEIFPRLSRRTRGVIDECCRNPERGCTKNELKKYCSKYRTTTTTTPPPILSNSIDSVLLVDEVNNIIGPDSLTSRQSQTMVSTLTTTTQAPGNEIFFYTVPTIRNVVANDN